MVTAIPFRESCRSLSMRQLPARACLFWNSRTIVEPGWRGISFAAQWFARPGVPFGTRYLLHPAYSGPQEDVSDLRSGACRSVRETAGQPAAGRPAARPAGASIRRRFQPEDDASPRDHHGISAVPASRDRWRRATRVSSAHARTAAQASASGESRSPRAQAHGHVSGRVRRVQGPRRTGS